MPRTKSIVIALFVLAGLAGSVVADTLKEQAKRDVTAGLAAQKAGHYDEAIALYKKAYDAVPHHELLFNLAQAYRLKGDVETALGYYQRYLAVDPSGRVAGDARRWKDDLEKLIAERKAEQSRKGEEARKTEEARKAEQSRKAEETRKTEETRRAEQTRKAEEARKAEENRKAEAAARRPDPTRTAQAGPGDGRPEARDEPPRGSSRRTYAVATGAVGAAALISGAVFGVLARGKLDDAIAICGEDRICDTPADNSRANALLADSRTRGNVSTVLFAVGGAGLVTGAILWFTGGGETRTAVAPAVTGSSVGVTVGGRF